MSTDGEIMFSESENVNESSDIEETAHDIEVEVMNSDPRIRQHAGEFMVNSESGDGIILKPKPADNIYDRALADRTPDPVAQSRIINSITSYRRNIEHYAGLSKPQRKFLLMRGLTESDAEVCKELSITQRQVSNWKSKNEAFRRAYATLWSDPVEFSENMLTTLLPKAIHVLDEMMDSPKERGLAVKLITQSRGILRPDKEEVMSNYEMALAHQLLSRGKELPPGLKKYASDGIDAAYSPETAVEGEYQG